MQVAIRSRPCLALDAVAAFYAQLEPLRDKSVFIALKKRQAALAEAERLECSDLTQKPLYGLLFAVKDNIDVEGMPTTAACPAFSYLPSQSAEVVKRLEAAGAIVVGKTNMDQFATGLVGVRSPFGIPQNALRPDLVPGGSSSGSAVAVAKRFVDFALGTDTAGSGRIPAGMNGIVGLKPTLGLISSTGVVPACRTLDTVSILARDVDLAFRVLQASTGYDAQDSFSRALPAPVMGGVPARLRIGVPAASQRQFFGDEAADAAYAADLVMLQNLGFEVVEIDFEPFHAVTRLLYEGPWLAERYAAIKPLIETDPFALLPVTRSIIAPARGLSAVETFEAIYRLSDLKRLIEPVMAGLDCLAVPTIPRFYTVSEVTDEPLALNVRLGTYTNFVNLLDLAAVSVPAGRRWDDLPSSLTFIAPGGSDGLLASLAQLVETREAPVPSPRRGAAGRIELAVTAGHLSGLLQNRELRDLGASFVRNAKTAPDYRLLAVLSDGKTIGGLAADGGMGSKIQTEVWALDASGFGRFAASLPLSLMLGSVILEDGTAVKAVFVAESAARTAEDVTRHGSWRAYLGWKD
jgi:allophanate hydrolase